LGTLEFFPTAYLDPEKNENKKTKNNSDSEKKSAKSDKVEAKNNNSLKG
jgi:hypothetical protein